ncbi:Gamma-glutamyltransferase [Rasamsonia emersonii CBS 393.64]|uniref:Gamma-glutamyltransferase n=1 Tax=Rasamsonia emersonii (strain ATCC 16479 / CBS 393.64 / IMI 116815) TaxID=1408163 RepID=A0A0F4YJM6_RASE3|nr:Gamma-glutamyltransferase [Rasamsonia emersonii CBS 393.64]KKA18424.1 Gamma-glutamyltransferase [Rasamsonia emersonii CBS 393.64]
MLNATSVYRTSRSSLSSSFPSRRSVVHSCHGIVACTQPLAAAAGQRILREGGNAADAAVAVDLLTVCTHRVHALNGSGRSPAAISLEAVRKRLGARSATIPITDVCAVTVPGAAAGWVDVVDRFGSGKLSLMQILRPAIELAEEGFPVSEIAAWMWQNSEDIIRTGSPHTCQDYLVQDPKAKDGLRAPRAGEIFKNPHLARTFRLLAEEGKKGFYQSRIAESIVQAVQDRGGFLSLEDLQFHLETGSQEVDALSLTFDARHLLQQHEHQEKGYMPETVRLWEHPPNGQGIVALMALGIMQQLARTGRIRPFSRADHNSVEYLHAVIESLRIAFADAKWWVTDPDIQDKLTPTHLLLSESYLSERAQLFSPDRKATNLRPLGHRFKGRSPAHNHCDTAYFAVTDRWGKGISFINSLYGNFGTGIIPPETGIILQGRGASFSLDPAHPNVVAPRKRPYHTIIPALTTCAVPIPEGNDTTDEEVGSNEVLHSVYGVMGGFMQPQGHVQVLLNQLLFGHTPQGALDAPRICVGGWLPGASATASTTSEEEDSDPSDTVFLEEGIPEHVAAGLRQLGHRVHFVRGWGEREMFGRGQIIRCHYDSDGRVVYSAGSDPRGDGGAFPV